MRAKQGLAVLAAVLGTVVVGGCSADGEAPTGQNGATQDAAPETATAAPAADEAMDDAAICIAFGDVLTIVENADLGLADGRMEAREHEGWHQLPTRVLDRLPSTGDSTVHTAITQLQEIAPAVPSGAGYEPTGVRSPEWYEVKAGLRPACDDLGAPLAIKVFTGG